MAITPLDMAPAKLSANPSMNKRWPPLADRTSLPYKLTSLSRQKLAREATAPNPDIRRCLGHFRCSFRLLTFVVPGQKLWGRLPVRSVLGLKRNRKQRPKRSVRRLLHAVKRREAQGTACHLQRIARQSGRHILILAIQLR